MNAASPNDASLGGMQFFGRDWIYQFSSSEAEATIIEAPGVDGAECQQPGYGASVNFSNHCRIRAVQSLLQDFFWIRLPSGYLTTRWAAR